MVRPRHLDAAAIIADLLARPKASGKVLAGDHGCSEATISRYRRELRLRPTIPERIALVAEAVMADARRTNAEVAALTGMSRERVRQLRHMARLPCRQPGPRRERQESGA